MFHYQRKKTALTTVKDENRIIYLPKGFLNLINLLIYPFIMIYPLRKDLGKCNVQNTLSGVYELKGYMMPTNLKRVYEKIYEINKPFL